MRDFTVLSSALVDSLTAVGELTEITNSPTIVFSGDVDVRGIALTDDHLASLPWLHSVKGGGYASDIGIRSNRSRNYNDTHAYAVSVAFANGRFGRDQTGRRGDRVSNVVREELIKALLHDATSVVSPDGALQSSDSQLGRRLVIVSILERGETACSTRLWDAVAVRLVDYDIQALHRAPRHIDALSSWRITTKWGCMKVG